MKKKLALALSLAALVACGPVDSTASGNSALCDLDPCPPAGEIDDSCSPACEVSEYCYASACYDRQGFEDPTGCWLAHDESCEEDLYCSYASGMCESFPRTDCEP